MGYGDQKTKEIYEELRKEKERKKTFRATWTISKHPLYGSWHAMMERCYNPNSTSYHNYGGRGIIVCPRWLSFLLFVTDMDPKPTPQHSLDRINNNGNYEPTNCRWATATQQANNRRNNSPKSS